MSFKKPFRAVPVVLGPHVRREQERRREIRFPVLVAGGMALTSVTVWTLTDPAVQSTAGAATIPAHATAADPVFFFNCSDARAHGAAPIYRGQPGYREDMDGDLDGIACEPPPRSSWHVPYRRRFWR